MATTTRATLTSQIPVALQLFSVRRECARDLPGVLSALRNLGYQGVEFAGFYGQSAREIKQMLKDNSLQCCGSHTPLDQLSTDNFSETVEFNRAIGNRTLIVPGLPAQYHSLAGWSQAAALFNDLSDRLGQFGMRIGYHNHAVEFAPLSGQIPWDIFFSQTRPEVIMQMDLGNARYGGADPLALLSRYPGRTKSIHVKDSVPGQPDVPLGTSDFDWRKLARLCESVAGTEWYIIEHEAHDTPGLQAAEQSLRWFHQTFRNSS